MYFISWGPPQEIRPYEGTINHWFPLIRPIRTLFVVSIQYLFDCLWYVIISIVSGLIQVIEERTFVWQKRAWHLYSQANIRKPSAALRAWQGTTVANAHVLTLGTRRQILHIARSEMPSKTLKSKSIKN